MNDETLVVRASCPINMYLITPGSAVIYNFANFKYELVSRKSGNEQSEESLIFQFHT
ncbi:MAG: hypothetical protein ACKOPK_09835 [Dolichospermum sp.]